MNTPIATHPSGLGMRGISRGGLLRHIDNLQTSGARAAEIFYLQKRLFFAVSQLAHDRLDTSAHMNGGDSDTDMMIFEWRNGAFISCYSLPVPGGEDAEFFTIADRTFLATASARTGAGPYEPNVDSVIYEHVEGDWLPFQRIPGFLAKQWTHFTFGERHFLGSALGVTIEGPEATNPRNSCIFEWDGASFIPFCTLNGPWGYNWAKIAVENREFLAYADHTGQSVLLEWNGSSFETFQRFEGKTGRAFHVLPVEGKVQVAFASIADDTVVYQWNGRNFEVLQVLSGPGAREFASVSISGKSYLVQVNFIEGSLKAPKSELLSYIYQWSGTQWKLVDEFETFGGTDACFFDVGSSRHLVVTNSLTPDILFGQATAVYEFLG